MRNFARINNYYNRIEARKDWNKLAEQAKAAGLADYVEKLQPPADAGWRLIDKRIGQLRLMVESASIIGA